MASSVWKNRDFVFLVSGQTLSEFGSSITAFAIPWVALEMTGSALKLGLMFAIGMASYLIVSLPSGVWADRYNRKHLMMLADTGRMIFVLSIPLAQSFHVLSVWHLFIVQIGMGALNAVFDSSYVSCLPNVVEKEQLRSANSVIQAGMSSSQILGPPLAGTLIAIIGAPNTIVINVATYAISATTLLLIRKSFSASDRGVHKQIFAAIGEGLSFVWKHDLIRTISLYTMVWNLASSATGAVLLFRLQHELHLAPYWIGAVNTGFSIGAICGSILSGALVKRFSMGHLMVAVLAISIVPAFVMVWTGSPYLIWVCFSMFGMGAVIWNVQSLSLRQSVIPDHMLGRASSAIRMVVWGSQPVGNTIGGALGQAFGTPVVFAAGAVINVGMWLTSLRSRSFKAAGHDVLPSADVTTSSS